MALGSTPGDKGGRCVELKTIPPSCADCLEIWEPQPPGTLRACPGLYRDESKQSNPITSLDRSRGFQEVEAPRFQDNQLMKVVGLSALRTGHLYPQ